MADATMVSEWLARLERVSKDEEIKASTTSIEGLRVHVSEDSSLHSVEVSQTLHVEGENLCFVRTGTKEISYENWVDTWWGDWAVSE